MLQYRLSGIGQSTRLTVMFEVPRDRDMALLGRPHFGGRGNKFMKVYAAKWLDPNTPRERQCSYGYPIHARCRDFIERFFGAEAEKHLECLLHALQERWADLDFQISGPSCLDYQKCQEKWTKKAIPFYDPVKIPALSRGHRRKYRTLPT